MAHPGYDEFLADITRLLGSYIDGSESELVRASEPSAFGHLKVEMDVVIEGGRIRRADGSVHFRRSVRLKEAL